MICVSKHHAQFFAFCGGGGNSQRVSSFMSVLNGTPWPTGSLTFHHGKIGTKYLKKRQESCFLPEVGPFEDSVRDHSPIWPSARHAGDQSMFTIKTLHMPIGDRSMGRNHSD